MSDGWFDGDQTWLEELCATPVGRRWLLKAGLGSALALGARAVGGPAVAAAAPRIGKSTVRTDLQFALRSARGVSDLVLVANGAKVELTAHTASSRAALRAQGGLWGAIDLAALTHFVSGVALPADQGLLLSVRGPRGKRQVLVSQMWYVPRQATLALAKTSLRLTGSLKHVVGAGASPRLQALGISPSTLRSPAQVADLDTIGDSYQTATALTMLHPNVATKDPTASAATTNLLGQTPQVRTLGTTIADMQDNGDDFATYVPVTNKDGSPAQITVGDTTTGFSTIALNDSNPGFVRNLKSSVSAGIVGVRDTQSLGAVIDTPLDENKAASTQTWVQPQGVLASPVPYSPSLRAGAGIDVKIKNSGTLFGTKTVANGSVADGKVPIKIYNNWVRWVWAYVQYLGPNGDNLSLNEHPTWPDTKYAQSLALVPQVFTVLGVPLWDTNTIDVTLDFPKEAHSARILYCGLGADLLGGGWRQYFPADAYPHGIAPTIEVVTASVITAVLTIGLNIFALATDFNIIVTWGRVRTLLSDAALKDPTALERLGAVASGSLNLTTAEAVTASVVTAGATDLEILNSGNSLENLWSILLRLGSIIPKVLFGPASYGLWKQVAIALFAELTADKLIEAIPIIGQAMAVVSAVGDAVTLEEVAAETVVAPWVIENEVSLTYQAQITVSKDDRASTWPATGKSWRLEALVDGAVVLDPITGPINGNQSKDLVVNVTAPFGGAHIQWSLVVLDADNRQVGTGVSAQYVNDDPAHPASAVKFAITEIAATITASTVFKRAQTTTYSNRAGGYTWSDQVPDAGTVHNLGIQEVTGATVATKAGVAAAVWKQNDRYYLRGVPLADNGLPIKLISAPKEGYVRRPFLLLDPFVDKNAESNHVLLEPEETSDAYQVRKVSLDSVTGGLKWDSSVSYGTFMLPVSAAALHSSGRVVAVNTDSGRLAWLLPAATPRPQLASYVAGPGTQVGLLSSPIAIAMTNPGVVLVLEAAAAQIAAFDLNGNPVQYFQSAGRLGVGGRRRLGDPASGYRLALVSAGSYLDLAVDGSDQIYALYYTGTGADPADYHVDVYTKDGTALDTNSPGVNVPHLAVDYWRSIFAANYSALVTLETKQPRIDPGLGVLEPSLSRFDPTRGPSFTG